MESGTLCPKRRKHGNPSAVGTAPPSVLHLAEVSYESFVSKEAQASLERYLDASPQEECVHAKDSELIVMLQKQADARQKEITNLREQFEANKQKLTELEKKTATNNERIAELIQGASALQARVESYTRKRKRDEEDSTTEDIKIVQGPWGN